ncbi:MAG TPA: TetR-like C-terminal domain-containing protein [Phototrophicaceae bacterium]|nr:TetR-like C-terminal domain-containing protein [Phototrophicaceae bacterium]
MPLPATIQIGSVPYTVVEKSDLHYTDKKGRKQWLNGHVVFPDAEIRVSADQAKAVQTVTLWHESLHALLYAAGMDEVPERAVRALGYALVQFVRDNPELVRLTIGTPDLPPDSETTP